MCTHACLIVLTYYDHYYSTSALPMQYPLVLHGIHVPHSAKPIVTIHLRVQTARVSNGVS